MWKDFKNKKINSILKLAIIKNKKNNKALKTDFYNIFRSSNQFDLIALKQTKIAKVFHTDKKDKYYVELDLIKFKIEDIFLNCKK